MQKSAALLGREVGLTAQEMNYVLREDGYLTGGPGEYSVTEKGAPYAVYKDEFRGNPNSLAYSKSWSTRSWDESILDELDISRDRAQKIRLDLAEQRRLRRDGSAPEAEDSSSDSYVPYTSSDAVHDDDAAARLAAVGAAIALFAIVVGVRKAAPPVKRWWQANAAPRIDRMLGRETGPHEGDSPA